jgi:GNAT superfamily N-acetyltransferase
VIIRPAAVEEVELLAELGLHFCHTGIFPLLADATEETLIGLLLAVFQLGEKGLIVVAEDRGGQVVGGLVAAVLPQPITQRDYADELCYWLEPVARGGEAARLLLDAFECWVDARGLGCKMVAPCQAPWDRIGAVYRRRGYTAIETVFYRAARPRSA